MRPASTARRSRRSRAVAVQRVDAPCAQVVRVVAGLRVAGGGAEVGEIAGRAGRVVLVVARRRPCPDQLPAPGRGVAVPELAGGAVGVDVVPERGDRPGQGIQQLRRRLVAARRAGRDVAGADEDRRGRFGGLLGRGRGGWRRPCRNRRGGGRDTGGSWAGARLRSGQVRDHRQHDEADDHASRDADPRRHGPHQHCWLDMCPGDLGRRLHGWHVRVAPEFTTSVPPAEFSRDSQAPAVEWDA